MTYRLTNARIEAINTTLRVITRRAYGFHSADALIALAEQRYPNAETAAEAKRLMRDVLDHYLESRRIESRRIVADLHSLDEDAQ